MPQQSYTVYKDGTDFKVFQFDSDSNLDQIRTAMGDFANDNLRFIDYQNKKTTYNDMILSENFEQFVPISKVIGLKNQLYLTDVTKTVKTDLVGFNTDWFFDRYMSCRVALNTEAAAQPLNAGKMPPLMLNNVKTANPNLRGFGAMDKVVVCEKDSIISFAISSWGAAGYGFKISPEAGTPINKFGLFATFTACTGKNYAATGLSRYYSDDGAVNGRMIQVVPTSTMNIGNGQTLQYMKITVKTWNVSGYTTKDGSNINCSDPLPTPQVNHSLRAAARFANFAAVDSGDHATPFGALAAASGKEVVVPGNTITPGSTVPANQQSGQQFAGGLTSLQDNDSPSGIIGEVTFYVFVFNSHDDAMKVFSGVNDINPAVWSQ
jgi:hypothetical protein